VKQLNQIEFPVQKSVPLKQSSDPAPSIKDKKSTKNSQITKITEDKLIHKIQKLVKKIIERYVKLKPELINLENYYIDISLIFQNITKKINKINI
jgi:hypothetical protein